MVLSISFIVSTSPQGGLRGHLDESRIEGIHTVCSIVIEPNRKQPAFDISMGVDHDVGRGEKQVSGRQVSKSGGQSSI